MSALFYDDATQTCPFRTLELDRQSLPSTHENFGITYANMGMAYSRNGNDTTALEYLLKAKEVWRKSLPLTHPRFQEIETYIRFAKERLTRI